MILIEAQKGADFSDTDIRNEVDTFMFEVIRVKFAIIFFDCR